jgi:hypothetical protein
MPLVLAENGKHRTGVIGQLDVRILIAKQHHITIYSISLAAYDIAFADSLYFETFSLWAHESSVVIPFERGDISFVAF